LDKGDLLVILDIVNRHALVDPSDGGPQDDVEYTAHARMSQKLAKALREKGVRVEQAQHPLSSGVITLWTADTGSFIDYRA
jgi:hypothetical protein